jgi:hypothetical protein
MCIMMEWDELYIYFLFVLQVRNGKLIIIAGYRQTKELASSMHLAS